MAESPQPASYEITPSAEGWTIIHDGRPEGTFDTPRAAFDEAVFAAISVMAEGRDVSISIAGVAAQR